jgi:hypothetical protein
MLDGFRDNPGSIGEIGLSDAENEASEMKG